MVRRHHAIVLISSMALVSALAAGCSDDEPATPQAIFSGRLERGNTNCDDTRALFALGEFGNPGGSPPLESRAVKDGETDVGAQGGTAVQCSVIATGPEEFDVKASINMAGATGGSFTVTGKFKPTGEQTNITATFASRQSGNNYREQAGCRVTYSSGFQGVAAGRVWGEIICPNAERTSTGTGDIACEAHATFKFENCDQ